jgi:alanyl-tRNA synthetase
VLSKETRSAFLEFFARRGHTIVASSSLVPEKDPSLLFVNAGMVQFKNVFLGLVRRSYVRATSSQKCVRAGGKHNDLGNVGKTLRHHTFFEMLGNFSFGDYFKKEAIAYAWEFLRKTLNLDERCLWVTVFREDDDAEELWKAVGVSPSRIVRLGEKDNFWSMGDEGPCGPCSEIIYDLGPRVGCRQPTCAVGCDCDRYLEIWNLVFMEYERSRGGDMVRLPNPSIDTGMGLERIVSVLEGRIGSYETDLFMPLLRRLEEISGEVYGEGGTVDTAFRVIADHVRGATFIINDGVLPGREGRGYVLRRILRRALRYGKKIGIEKDFVSGLSRVVVDTMGDAYPEIKNNYPFILGILKGEEERFLETLNVGMRLYEDVKKESAARGDKVIPGDVVYRLYDTFGFPVDITDEMAREDGLFLDMAGFERALDEQKERSRTDRRMKNLSVSASETFGVIDTASAPMKNIFTGYDALESDAAIVVILKEGQPVEEIREGDDAHIFFDKTPFYGEAGGQTSDDGIMEGDGAVGSVGNVTRVKETLFSHAVRVEKGAFRPGESVHLTVDREKRRAVARNHSATHLLQFALKTVLGDHVKQSGSLVERDRLRFDFTHFRGLTSVEVARVEDIANEKILDMVDVKTEVKSREDAIREGATALFEEKYGETVRVVSMGEFSRELCGGTHVKNTGEIGSFSIISEGSLASGIRRIEAVTGKSAVAYRRKIETVARAVSRDLKTDIEGLQDRVGALLEEMAAKEKEVGRLRDEMMRQRVEEAIKGAHRKDGATIVSMFMPGGSADDLRKATDIIREKLRSCVVVVGTRDETKGIIVAAVTKDLVNAFNAGQIIKSIAVKYHGKGGGNPQMAQGGVPAEAAIEALSYVNELLAV